MMMFGKKGRRVAARTLKHRVSPTIGAALTLYVLRRSLGFLLLLALGGYLLYRGGGRRRVEEAYQVGETGRPRGSGRAAQTAGPQADDEVETASEQSFPASDPPSWTMSRPGEG